MYSAQEGMRTVLAGVYLRPSAGPTASFHPTPQKGPTGAESFLGL